MSSPELIDERFADLVRELRLARPLPSVDLRTRVRSQFADAPEPRSRQRLSFRGAAVALATLCVVALVGAAIVHGVVSDGGAKKTAAKERGTHLGLLSEQEKGRFAQQPPAMPLAPAALPAIPAG